MKIENISTECILTYIAKSILNVFTNLVKRGTLCDVNYIFADQD